MLDFIKDRCSERTSLDGSLLIAVGVVCLMFGPLVKYAAYAAVVYGVYTLLKPE
tara:strand:+ start:166 stop:327 length:162 start_codon:yes stop_codon:yes gene_type:complete